MDTEKTTMPPQYTPTVKESNVRDKVYKYFTRMYDVKHEPLPHFAGQYGNRSFMQYIDDSERVLNGFQMGREDQGKEDWEVFAWALRKVMSKASNLATCDLQFRELLKYQDILGFQKSPRPRYDIEEPLMNKSQR